MYSNAAIRSKESCYSGAGHAKEPIPKTEGFQNYGMPPIRTSHNFPDMPAHAHARDISLARLLSFFHLQALRTARCIVTHSLYLSSYIAIGLLSICFHPILRPFFFSIRTAIIYPARTEPLDWYCRGH